MTKGMVEGLLSAIVLLEPAQDASLIEEVLLSLAVQNYGQLQIIVAGDKNQIEAVKKLAKTLPLLPQTQLDTVEMPIGSKDNNATRLNAAVSACLGQFISMLQSNDIVYGFAFEKLIETLRNSSESVAVGGTRNAFKQVDGFIASKANHYRTAKKTCDIWFDEDCARNFVINRATAKGALSTEPALDFSETYFLLLTLSLHNEFNFSLADQSLFERRLSADTAQSKDGDNDDVQKLRLRAQSKVIDWKSEQLTKFMTRSKPV